MLLLRRRRGGDGEGDPVARVAIAMLRKLTEEVQVVLSLASGSGSLHAHDVASNVRMSCDVGVSEGGLLQRTRWRSTAEINMLRSRIKTRAGDFGDFDVWSRGSARHRRLGGVWVMERLGAETQFDFRNDS